VIVRYPRWRTTSTAAFVLGLPVETMKADVLVVRLTKNHALPDGNKRPALATTIEFCDVNGFDWIPPAGDDQDGEEIYQLMLAIAAAPGVDLEAVEGEVAAWIRERLTSASEASVNCSDTPVSSRLGDPREHLSAGCAQAAPADPEQPGFRAPPRVSEVRQTVHHSICAGHSKALYRIWRP
jgi:hypothetical protein